MIQAPFIINQPYDHQRLSHTQQFAYKNFGNGQQMHAMMYMIIQSLTRRGPSQYLLTPQTHNSFPSDLWHLANLTQVKFGQN